MKKAVLFVIALILLSIITNAQNSSSASKPHCFDESTRLMNVGLGLSANYYNFGRGYGYTYHNSPAFSLSYEQPWSKKLGPGFLGVGAYLGFQTTRYKYDNYEYNGQRYYYQHRYSNYIVAARAVYHWDGLNFEKAEVYGGAIAGLRFQTYHYSSNITDPYYTPYYNASSFTVRPVISVFAGARWYFAPKVGVFGEVSPYGISYVTIGLTFKL